MQKTYTATFHISTVITVIIALVLLAVLTLCSKFEPHKKVKICKDFKTWVSAQEAFNADSVKYSGLDRDGDKRVCESMKKSL